ncbi:unnamed protein product [Spodoptera exigua]|nr:unnamed protein product [Spodoptera exigua]
MVKYLRWKSWYTHMRLSAKTEKTPYVYFPPLQFGERRQFARVFDSEYPFKRYIWDLIWYRVVNYIPTSYMDGLFDTPYPVYDIRHQDAVLYHVHDAVLNRSVLVQSESNINKRRQSKTDKKKFAEESNPKFDVQLSGDWILAGVGRVIPFVTTGLRLPELGELITLISTSNLPSYDDFAIFFANITNLFDLPLDHLVKNNFTHVYTRWTLSDEDWRSEQISLEKRVSNSEVNFNDHHALPLSSAAASDVMATFLEEPFCIELRGIRIPPTTQKSKFFGYDKNDRDFAIGITPPMPNQEVDILIAQTKIDSRALKKVNAVVKGEFSLFPPETYIVPLEREGICTNDINAIRTKVKPEFVIQPSKVLEAQMTLEVSFGLVGCKPHPTNLRYSRLYCLISDHNAIMAILRHITEINELLLLSGHRLGLLTGFALDTGDTVILGKLIKWVSSLRCDDSSVPRGGLLLTKLLVPAPALRPSEAYCASTRDLDWTSAHEGFTPRPSAGVAGHLLLLRSSYARKGGGGARDVTILLAPQPPQKATFRTSGIER